MESPRRVIAQGFDQLAEGLDVDRTRMLNRGSAQDTLSVCWLVDDRHDRRHAMTCESFLVAVTA